MARKNTSKKFPASLLSPVGGDIYAHIFENSAVGLPRGLFWSVTIEFGPILHGKEEFDCSMTCEWLLPGIRDWRSLNGQDWAYLAEGESTVETSFYMTQHDEAELRKLTLKYKHENIIEVSMEMSVNFSGYFGGDEDPCMQVNAEKVELPLSNLIIVKGNLEPAPTSVEEAISIAAEYVDLSAFHEPEDEDWRYVFAPRW